MVPQPGRGGEGGLRILNAIAQFFLSGKRKKHFDRFIVGQRGS